MDNYNHKEIENAWHEVWSKNNLYKTQNKAEGKENYYLLFEFPYPSGNLHIGHWYAFAIPDIFARMKRMSGYNVLFPIGFDAFGLPAENAAIKRGLDPKKWTYENIAYMEGQLQSMGGSFDWSRKVVTADPEYYKWTQWLFLQFYKKGLAYKKKASVNWCPSCQTVLANEQVINGKCERCGTEVIQKDLEQWFFKITDYADRLIDDLKPLKWPEAIKDSQINWIGRSEGAELNFKIKISNLKSAEEIKVFTTRADTLFGVTYVVLSPEHELISNIKSQISNFNEVERYIEEAKTKTEIERTDAKKSKTGVELKGIKAVNPANGEEVPVWIADYVLNNYGTGAVMAVPAHDERDFAFAQKYNLPIKEVLIPRMPDPTNPHIDGKEVVFRNAVIAVLRDPKTDKLLVLKWKKQPWTTFVMGGIEDGERPEEAGEREIKEETGYKNIKFIRALGGAQSEFFAAHKDVNRIAHTRSLLFELVDETKSEIGAEESEIHEPEWRSMEEIKATKMTHSEMGLIIDALENKRGPYTDEGIVFNSGEFTRMDSKEAREKITEKFGKKVTKYKLRDWLLSRQRYWGAPIPVVYDPEGQPHPIPEEHLPWLLPEDNIDFTPKGASPLASSVELKGRVEKIFGRGWTPEYDTMDTFVDSSWYFLRYTDPHNSEQFASKESMDAWMPVTKYSGGAEHTTMHLLYSRFFHKALFDMGLVKDSEPYTERMNRGLILGPDGQKMSKSKGNVINPDEQVAKFGADTVRMYLAFIGPYNEAGQYPWDIGGIVGTRRFLERVWRIGHDTNLQMGTNPFEQGRADNNNTKNKSDIESLLNKTIKKVTEDITNLKFNTAISAMMVLVNELDAEEKVGRETFETLLKLLAPFAPHITEEIWHNLGHQTSIHLEKWPEFDESKMAQTRVKIVVQINSRVRAQFEAEVGIKQEEVEKTALSLPEIQKWLSGGEPKRVVYIPDKLINFVV